MAFFHIRWIAPRPDYPQNAREVMQAIEKHFLYWRSLGDDARAIAVIPVVDQLEPSNMALVEVADHDDADTLAMSDPLISACIGFEYNVSSIPSIILRQN